MGINLESFLCDKGLKKAWFLAYKKKKLIRITIIV